MKINKNDWNRYLNKDVLLKVYSVDGESDEFLLGYMVNDIDSYYIFESIDEYGGLDGYILYKKDAILKIERDNDYTAVFDFYINYLKERKVFDVLNLSAVYEKAPKNSIDSILQYCYKNDLVITISQAESEICPTGKIISLNEKEVSLDRKRYRNDFGIEQEAEDAPISISDILTVDITTKETYLYQKYLEK
ncbi:hypothetical protein [Lactobacillus panisapium]|uniref:hypothetical protein n=1 Tax=Lactobacillus panisapium TaxID=2012495 RepID=UPI000CDB51ED|nr:hypothetical protein [Lactobacillus panisapium]